MENENKIRSTTVIAVRRNGKVAMAGDGQVTMGNTVMKGNAKKCAAFMMAKFLQDLPEQPQTLLLFLINLKKNSRHLTATLLVPLLSLQNFGEQNVQ